MASKLWVVAACLGALLSGCAGVRSSRVAEPVDSESAPGFRDIVISGEIVDNLSSRYFGYFDFTIENNSDRWHVVKIDSIWFDGAAGDSAIRFPSGDTLLLWRNCMERLNRIGDFNQALALGAIAGIGVGVAALSDNRAAQEIGAAAALGSAAYGMGSSIEKAQGSLRLAVHREPFHLLRDSSIILPGLFEKRWLLVNSADHARIGYLERMRLRVRLDGQTQVVTIRFRDGNSFMHTVWQDDIKPKSGSTGSNASVSRKPAAQ